MSAVPPVRIGADMRTHERLGLGGTTFGPHQFTGREDANLLAAMETSIENGVTHFDTATGYGDGYSERLIGRFMAEKPDRRGRLFLASKASLDELTARGMLDAIDASRKRLQTDVIDLYYIHWPRKGQDLRPLMQGLETARGRGKIRAVGVSNFSVQDMEQVAEVGKIDAHQLGYNLLWRVKERAVIPYCVANGIAVITYSSLAHGILAGRLPRETRFPEGDQRGGILLFRDDIWPHIYERVEELKAVAERSGRPLAHLALRWLLAQTGVTAVLVGARDARQAASNAQALEGAIAVDVLHRLTKISDNSAARIPDEENPYGYHP